MSFQHLHFSTVHLIIGMLLLLLRSSLFCGLTFDWSSPQRGFFIWHMGHNDVRFRGGLTAVALTLTALKIYQPSISQQGSRRWQRILYYINNFRDDWRDQRDFRRRTGRSRRTATR